MCGIFLTSPANPDIASDALRIHNSRGPDSCQLVELDFCTLGVNRLSISGLENGDQPLWSADRSIVVIYNGAIYNFSELCRQYGFSPSSDNDGEIIHFLYQKFGTDFAKYLEGMFAIIIVDINQQDIIYCVDQVGIKPLYVVKQANEFVLSSTLQAIPEKLRIYARRVPSNVVWSLRHPATRIDQLQFEDYDLLDLLRQSVAEQIPIEVAWGCMLSGGVDSSLITALASEFHEEVHTFTCGTSESSDLHAARSVSKTLGTIHHEVEVDLDELVSVVNSLIKETGSFEIWTIMGGVGTYLTARHAAKLGFKVLLSGEGADELFAGYDEFSDVAEPLLEAKLLQYQTDLAVSECLRLDRATMACSIEARVPFLSASIINFARRLPRGRKLEGSGKSARRKAELRDCALKILPSNVAERTKVEFKDGSGLASHLYALGQKFCTADDVENLRQKYPTFGINNPVSAWLFTLWLEHFGSSIGENCIDMRDRGIIRQEVNDYIRHAHEFQIHRDDRTH